MDAVSDVTPGQRATADRAGASKGVPGRGKADAPPAGPPRPLLVTGLVGALWCIGIGLAVLTTVTLIGWIAAPRTALGQGLPGVFRTVVNFWLVSHHAGFAGPNGRVGLLPLGLLVLPAALLYRGGGWVIRAAGAQGRVRAEVPRVAVALAVPYALLAAALAVAAAAPSVRPSAWQALLACFVVAMGAGGLGAARALVAARGKRIRTGLGALLKLLPERPRSLVIGVAGATAVLLASGALLVGGSLALHLKEADRLYDMLAPGVVGGILLLVVQLAYLPNAVIWGTAYAVGPGFSVGAGTSVSPTGVILDAVPTFPALAALPEPGPAPVLSLLALAAPFVAGAVGGALTVRAMPSPVYEAAPLWGFLSGALTGVVVAVLAALSGGPLGGGRMATMGPSAWQVGLMAALEVGIAAAIAAWVANWSILRRPAAKPEKAKPKPKAAVPLAAPVPAAPAPAPAPRKPAKPSPHVSDPVEFEESEPLLARRKPARAGRRADVPAAPPAELELELEPEPVIEPDPIVEEKPEAPPRPAPPRDDAGRTENRGGAIYVLRDEPHQD
ncbi:cell division protein PerM [Actinomadura hibisca]|uniref:cell division protein PerM n=1 Tax=Actinomadura hibisca TaxID=68565 RepID=UPI0035A25F1A